MVWYECGISKNIEFKNIEFNIIRYKNNIMEKQGKWLKNDFIKISNPLKIKQNSIKIECESDLFDFVTQQENYNKIKESNNLTIISNYCVI
jgi:hypothetical protein